MYTFRTRVGFSKLAADKKLSVPGIVDYFQDTTTLQAEDLGIGIPYLDERDLVWLMSYWQIVIDRYPSHGEDIVLGTYPYEFRGFMGLRNFVMEDGAGRTIVRANSVWTLMNKRTHKPSRPTKEMLERYELGDRLEMEYEPRKIAPRGEPETGDPFTVTRAHMDSNGHVNNGQYIYMAEEFLPEGVHVRQMRAEYRKMAMLHDTVVPLVYRYDDRVAVALTNPAREIYAIVEYTI